MNKLTLCASLVLAVLCAPLGAEEFKLRPNEVAELIDALSALDGYEHTVDQGPGNPARVVKEPYKFSRETRAKLGANRAALMKTARDLQAKVADVRLKISGDADKIDEKDAAQLKAFKEQTAPLNESAPVELSPIAADELTANDNPIPISVLSVLNRLRPVPK